MDYLKKEFDEYTGEREGGSTFEEFAPFKAHAFRSLDDQIKSVTGNVNNVLEVGFGSGYYLSLLASNGSNVHGIDIEPFTIDYAKKVLDDKGVKGNLSLGDGFQIPYRDNTFDLVVNVGTIEHFDFKEQEAFLREMARVSKDYVLIATPNDHSDSAYEGFKNDGELYHPEEENIGDLKDMSKAVGLRPVRNSGVHVMVSEKLRSKNLENLLASKGIVPPKSGEPVDLDETLELERRLTDEELGKFGFLKYALSRK